MVCGSLLLGGNTEVQLQFLKEFQGDSNNQLLQIVKNLLIQEFDAFKLTQLETL